MKTRILLVDDDHGPMEYFVQALRDRGSDVEHIDTADEFYSRLKRTPDQPDFDVAIVDMMMPHGALNKEEKDDDSNDIPARRQISHISLPSEIELAGIGHVQKIRAKYPSLPIVVLSNYDEPEMRALLPADVKFKAKFEVSPFEFADYIKSIVAKQS